MRFVTFAKNGIHDIGILSEDGATILSLSQQGDVPPNMQAFVAMGDVGLAAAKRLAANPDATKTPTSSIKILAPFPRPKNSILCVGRNYLEHVKETDAANPAPTHPIIFTKPPLSVTASGDEVDLHHNLTSSVDYEGELAVIIGKLMRNVPEEKAMDYIFGYTILNDVSARDLQKRHTQWTIGKGLDTFSPMGPCLVHKSALPNHADIRLTTRVNGEVRQKGNTKDLIFTIPYLASLLSQGMTLEPGDIIATGTPKGVGAGFNPPRFLRKGDTVEISVDGIGVLRNVFV